MGKGPIRLKLVSGSTVFLIIHCVPVLRQIKSTLFYITKGLPNNNIRDGHGLLSVRLEIFHFDLKKEKLSGDSGTVEDPQPFIPPSRTRQTSHKKRELLGIHEVETVNLVVIIKTKVIHVSWFGVLFHVLSV